MTGDGEPPSGGDAKAQGMHRGRSHNRLQLPPLGMSSSCGDGDGDLELVENRWRRAQSRRTRERSGSCWRSISCSCIWESGRGWRFILDRRRGVCGVDEGRQSRVAAVLVVIEEGWEGSSSSLQERVNGEEIKNDAKEMFKCTGSRLEGQVNSASKCEVRK